MAIVFIVIIVGGSLCLLLALAVLIMFLLKRDQRKAITAPTPAAGPGEYAAIEVDAVSEIPEVASAVEHIDRTRLPRTDGQTTVEGLVEFGSGLISWEPDEQALAAGAKRWQLPWSNVVGGSMRTATTSAPSALGLTLVDGGAIELIGVNEATGLAALRHVPAPG